MAFSFCATHQKHGGAMSSAEHLQMLLTSIEHNAPPGWPIVISSVGAATLWTPADHPVLQTLRRRAGVVWHSTNPGWQDGALATIVHALEWAHFWGDEYLVFCAEDILFLPPHDAQWLVERLVSERAAYVGGHWFSDHAPAISSQVFACRVSSLFEGDHCIFNCWRGAEVEYHIWRQLTDRGLPFAYVDPSYIHTHDPAQFQCAAASHFPRNNPQSARSRRRVPSFPLTAPRSDRHPKPNEHPNPNRNATLAHLAAVDRGQPAPAI
jgi:hypothetical protein